MQSLLQRLLLGNAGGGGGGNPTLNYNFVDGSAFPSAITFSRGSNATQFDSSGNLVYAPANLLTYSDQFDNLAWLKSAATVTANATASPDGTVNADKLIATAVSANHYLSSGTVTISAGASVTASVYVKAAEYNTIRIAAYNSAITSGFRVDANLSTVTGTTGTLGTGSATSSSVTNVGGGWYRVTVSGIIDASSTGIVMWVQMLAAGVSPFLGDGTSGIFVFGAQLNPTPVLGGVTESLSTYYPTTASAYYGPRLDYDPATLAAQGLLIEEQRTNSIRNSTMQGAVAGTPGTFPTNWSVDTPGLTTSVVGTGTQNGVTYIDVRLNGTTSAVYGNIFFEPTNGIAATNNQTWAHSLWLSVVGGSTTNVSTVRHAFDLYSSVPGYLSTVVSNLVGVSATQTRYGAALTTNNASTAFVRPSLSLLWSTGVAIDITLRIGLPQLELGAFATSVIPTTTTALTRSADVASVNTLSPWYNATEGTLFAQASLISSSYTNGVLLDVGAGGAFGTTEYISWVGTGWTLNPNTAPINVISSVATSSTAKVAAAIKVNDSVISANGLIGVTDTSCGIASAPTTLSIGRAGWTAGNYLNGWIQRITYYPVRLTNAALQQITT